MEQSKEDEKKIKEDPAKASSDKPKEDDTEDEKKIKEDLAEVFSDKPKVFNDPVHGHVELHPLLCKIIDTPQFQRLRNIKQMGPVYYVYPGASHNRFEHSIGVAHLAGHFARTLKEKQPELKIEEKDILCVAVAGLCHDLGHGPFSHLFDQRFIPKARKGLNWKHEQASIDMFDHLVKNNKLQLKMTISDLQTGKPLIYTLDEKDRDFIKEMIFGGPLPPETYESDEVASPEWPYKGRTKEKSFLYDIVSNKRNGIDVDKFDYFSRDCLHLGMKNSFDHERFIKFARVCKVEKDDQPGTEEWQICIRDKEVYNIYEMFHTRSRLHRRACEHKVAKIIELMITEAFVKADPYIKRKGSDEEMYTLSETIDDMDAYIKLTDHVFDEILNSTSEELKEAREILEKIITRRFYPCVGEIKAEQTLNITEEDEKKIKEDLAEAFSNMKLTPDDFVIIEDEKKIKDLAEAFSNMELTPDDFVIIVSEIDFGMGDKNPIENLRFYNKVDPDKAFKISNDQVSDFVLPKVFREQWFRFYCKKIKTSDHLIMKKAKKIFEEWRKTSHIFDGSPE